MSSAVEAEHGGNTDPSAISFYQGCQERLQRTVGGSGPNGQESLNGQGTEKKTYHELQPFPGLRLMPVGPRPVTVSV